MSDGRSNRSIKEKLDVIIEFLREISSRLESIDEGINS